MIMSLSFTTLVATDDRNAHTDLVVERVEGQFPLYDGSRGTQLRFPAPDDDLPPMRLWLSKERYWVQDRHLDAIVEIHDWDDALLDSGSLRVRLLDSDGTQVAAWVHHGLPGPRFSFYPQFPPEWASTANNGELQVVVEDKAGQQIAAGSQPFRLEWFDEPAARTGRVAILLPNENAVVATGVPVTVGVPFPRGALQDAANVRLVDSGGNEVAVQIQETGRWSKFGDVRWLLCDFIVALNGKPLELFLEYGPDVGRQPASFMTASGEQGFPIVEAGRLRIDNGVWFDVDDNGNYVKVLEQQALDGAFVEHEDGRLYRLPTDDHYSIEELGREKIVIHRQGWYRELSSGREFCQYEIRYVFYRNSPLLRIFHTWIFTGDGNRDRIANMGWQLPYTEGMSPDGFLSSFDPDAEWLNGDYLLQYNFSGYEVVNGDQLLSSPTGRAPGIARLSGNGLRLYFGARDFWQTFPSELEFADDALWFHNWPRHGKPQPDPLVDPATATLLQFAHSGEVLDFRLPEAYTEEPIDSLHSGNGHEATWETGQPDSINAQGVARTEEFWLWFAPLSAADHDQQRLMTGLNQQTLRAVVDTQWVADSGVFYETYPQDWEKHPEFEAMYEQWVTLLRSNRAENAGLYGMWLHGEHLWSWRLGPRLYRQLRKGHGGYGVLSWMPYARSGDPRLLQRHTAKMRRMIDANFCHYASEDVLATANLTTRAHSPYKRIFRDKGGFWARGPLPWAGRGLVYLDYETQPHQWWDAWYLTGYKRARDFALNWSERVKDEMTDPDEASRWQWVFSRGSRQNETIQKAFIDSYQNTFDPWFIVWSHHVAELHREALAKDTWVAYARFWSPGDREYHRFTGSTEHRDYFVDFARQSAGVKPGPLAYAWTISGDETLLRRLAGIVELFEISGGGAGAGGRVDSSSDLPMALAAFAAHGGRPDAIYNGFFQRIREYEEEADGTFVYRTPRIAMLKEANQPLPVKLQLMRQQTHRKADEIHRYWIYGPDGSEVMGAHLQNVNTLDPVPGETVTLPADDPPGVYRLEFEIRSRDPESMQTFNYGLRGIHFPVTPIGTPEVIELDEIQMGPAFSWTGGKGYFFMVPPTVESFQITGIASRQIAYILDPDGTVAWQFDGAGTSSATITAPPGQRGRLWRIVATDFTMDPQIPPIYSIDRDRWFDPDKYDTAHTPTGKSDKPE